VRDITKDTRLCISLSARPTNIGTRFHNHLYEVLDLDFVYKAFTTDDITAAIAGVRGLGIRGCSVSMPWKEDVIALVDEMTPSADAIHSVNTIVNDDGRLVAYNTDFIAIENERRPGQEYSYLTGWGQSAVLCLLDASWGDEPTGLPVFASGGVRTPLDVVRSLALGARAVGVSGHFLRTLVKEGPEALRQELHTWSEHVRTLMTLLGAPDVSQLRRTDVLVTGRTAEQARALGVDLGGLTHRREH